MDKNQRPPTTINIHPKPIGRKERAGQTAWTPTERITVAARQRIAAIEPFTLSIGRFFLRRFLVRLHAGSPSTLSAFAASSWASTWLGRRKGASRALFWLGLDSSGGVVLNPTTG